MCNSCNKLIFGQSYSGSICRNCYQKNYRNLNRVSVLEKKRKYRLAAKNKIQKYNKEYRIRNKNKYNEWRKQYRQSDKGQIYKLRDSLRTRFRLALKNNQKSGSVIQLLGCSVSELRKHLENKFQPGMTWETWGLKGWHIDHIIPLSNFDLTKVEDLKKACHYTNLQPLWWYENLSKFNKIL